MKPLYCDFHIHVGRSLGRPVKMAAAPGMTLESVLHAARCKKGLDIVTVIDAVTSNVMMELEALVQQGRLVPMAGGGLQFENGLVVLLGAEIEVGGPDGGAAHFGAWFGHMDAAKDFLQWLSTVQKNTCLSSQRAATDALTLQSEVASRGGMFIVHHAFTPHKGLYGNCVRHLGDMVNPALVDALELGLSADTDMADCLSELQDVTFLSNSDAHSVPKIAREYNALQLSTSGFDGVRRAFHRINGCSVTANYGLHTALGKYHRTTCLDCERIWESGAEQCVCGSTRRVMGVYDRLCEIRDRAAPVHPAHRPPYIHQVPLEFIPRLGPKAYERLLTAFGTEMAVLHDASYEDLVDVVGVDLANKVVQARSGQVKFIEGGGGRYGRVQFSGALS